MKSARGGLDFQELAWEGSGGKEQEVMEMEGRGGILLACLFDFFFFLSLYLFSKVRESEREKGPIFRKKTCRSDRCQCLSRPKAEISRSQVGG